MVQVTLKEAKGRGSVVELNISVYLEGVFDSSVICPSSHT